MRIPIPEETIGMLQCATTLMRNQVNPGDQLDHYRIDEVLAHTTVASIFRGTDLRTQRKVAIKIPHPDVESDPIFSERFQREEEIGRSLDHAGLMKVFSDGAHSRPYIVMEWFDGQLLRNLLNEKKKLPAERAERILLAITDVLDYVENHGVVHRDLRPENVMVNADDHIKLINFGNAAKTGARRVTFANLAQSVGMSEYVSPEELGGKRGDARSDIYALGVMLYEMLTGKTPFQGVEPFDRMGKDPTPPREIDPAISPQLQEVIYLTLERDPRKRYPNAHDLARNLRHLDQVSVTQRPELGACKQQRIQQVRRVLLYTILALLPIAIFLLLLYFAHR